jgi:hypothetical protein
MGPGTRVLEVPWTNGFERNLGEKIFVLFFSLKKMKIFWRKLRSAHFSGRFRVLGTITI